VNHLITGEAFGRLFTSFQRTARRLEARDHYEIAEEEDQVGRFTAGQLAEAEHRAYMADWMGMVQSASTAGKRFERVRIVPAILTDYLRLELRGNRYNAEAGEDVRYLERDRANTLDLPDHDFWLFDDERLALQYFTASGRPLGALVITEPDAVAQHALWLERAWAAAIPYADYLAEDPGREHPAGWGG
jgi:hypothetical protein